MIISIKFVPIIIVPNKKFKEQKNKVQYLRQKAYY